jgi:hypothetical protein
MWNIGQVGTPVTDLIITPIDQKLVRGALELERTERGLLPHRLPAWVRTQFPEEYLMRVEAQPSGVRLVFHTKATTIELDTVPAKTAYVGVTTLPDGSYDLVIDGEPAGSGTVPGGDLYTIDMATQATTITKGEAGTLRFAGLPARQKTVEIWLPQSETTELVSLRTDAPVQPDGGAVKPSGVLSGNVDGGAVKPSGALSGDTVPENGRVWLHHGSSISHGSTAASPTTTWPAVAARRGEVELINLGLSGNALLDACVARVLRDTPADLISLKLGINIVSGDLMRRRAFIPAVHGFLDTVRDGHPDTPLLVVSSVLCPIFEDTPGPGTMSMDTGALRFSATGDPADRERGKLTLGVVREELSRIVAERSADDPNLHYLDGRSLYGEPDYAESPLVDEIHPAPPSHRLIGERFADQVFGAGGVFA